MKKVIVMMVLVAMMLFSGCAGVYSDSALKYAKEGTIRVDSGYKAKAEMTKHITKYLREANEDCGVKVKMINGMPVTTVKECIDFDDAMASVDKLPIIKPQKVSGMLQSAGDFAIKVTNLAVPFASIYYGSQNHIATTKANVEITQSNNDAQSEMLSAYTSNFENTTVDSVVENTTVDTSTTLTDTSSTIENTTDTTINTVDIPTIDMNSTSTIIGG